MAQYSFVQNKTGGALTPQILDQDGNIVPLDVATSITFILIKPDGTEIQRTGSLTTDGTDGRCYYKFVAGDLDQAGVWYYWVNVVTAEYDLGTDPIKTFMVRSA